MPRQIRETISSLSLHGLASTLGKSDFVLLTLLNRSLAMDFDAPSDEDPNQLRREVSRYPTDLRLRFRLGVACCARKDYSGAIPELHKAMLSPHTRLQAMKMLVDAYVATGKSELATRMREQLSRESGEDSGSGSAPVPAPTRPITPPDSSRAGERPHEDDAV
jgi:hypothetical protein